MKKQETTSNKKHQNKFVTWLKNHREPILKSVKIVSGITAAVGFIYLIARSSDEDNNENCLSILDDENNNKEYNTMTKYKIIFDGEEQDEIFNTEEAAEEYALYLCSCYREGAEILHMSNPGDYDYDEDEFESPDYEIVEIDD